MGFDVVIECSGNAIGAANAMQAAKRGAQYIQVGIFGHDVTVPLDLVILRELTVTAGFSHSPAAWDIAIDVMSRITDDLRPAVGEIYSLTDWESAFAAMRAGLTMKVLIDPRR